MTEAAGRVVTWLDSRQAARLVQGVALLALVLSVWFGIQQYRLTECQARYAEASNTSQRARAEAAEVDRTAQDDMFKAIAAQPRQAITAVNQYLADREIANRQRAANPIPPPPSTNCG